MGRLADVERIPVDDDIRDRLVVGYRADARRLDDRPHHGTAARAGIGGQSDEPTNERGQRGSYGDQRPVEAAGHLPVLSFGGKR